MASIFDELKQNFRRPNNALNQLIIINVIVFVSLGILAVIASFSGTGTLFAVVDKQFTIPANIGSFIYRPWTIITYAFSHAGFMHILFNMLALYWFGMLISEYLGSAKVVNLYVLGAIAGGAIFLLAYNLIPILAERVTTSGMVGASAAVFAVAAASATLLPEYRFNLLFIGPVKIKYIVAVYIFISFLGTAGDNAGGNFAHLGGAGIGFLYIKGLQAGTDFGLWIQRFLEGVKKLFSSKPKIKVTYKKSSQKQSATASNTTAYSSNNTSIEQEEIDRILDKISDKGYESLSKDEKQKLFNASKK